MESTTVVFYAKGHNNIKSTHKTTLEFTKDSTITTKGDCIIAVAATKAVIDLPIKFKRIARKQNSRITIIVETNESKEIIKAFGHPKLQFSHKSDLVVRKSEFICSRTFAIKADKAAKDFSKKFIEQLKDSSQLIKITATVKNY